MHIVLRDKMDKLERLQVQESRDYINIVLTLQIVPEQTLEWVATSQ